MQSSIDAYKDLWRRYAQFNGRASVAGYWRVVLINAMIVIPARLIAQGFVNSAPAVSLIVALFLLIYGLATFIPWLALGTRRLHDTDKSGLLMLLLLIPVLGWIALVIFFAMSGTPGNNQYGSPVLDGQWSNDGFAPGTVYVAQAPGGTPPPPPPSMPN